MTFYINYNITPDFFISRSLSFHRTVFSFAGGGRESLHSLKLKKGREIMGRARRQSCVSLVMVLAGLLATLFIVNVHSEASPMRHYTAAGGEFSHAKALRRFETRFRRNLASVSPSPSPASSHIPKVSREYHLTSYGGDPTGRTDSTEALLAAFSDAFTAEGSGNLMGGIRDIGGATISLEGGNYLISRPIRFPAVGGGNLLIHGGTLTASKEFPKDGFLIDLSPPKQQSSSSDYNYEYITIRDVLLDCNYTGGGISVVNSLRTTIDNCYITHFTTDGITVQGGHETYIRNSYIGQHITTGGDPGERQFSGTGITLNGNDNAVTDVVIFSAAVGILISGQANTLMGVHCYNKATGFGGTGVYIRLPGLTQTRIVNCYMDYTGIVAEDPVQLLITNSFFLGDAFILLKSVGGVVNGVNVINNMFAGSDKGIEIVQLDQTKTPFKQIGQVLVDGNNVKGMKMKSTVGKGSIEGNGTSWTVDFNSILLFPDLINHVQYSLTSVVNGSFPNHALRRVSGNKVTVESNVAVSARVHVTVDQAS